MITPYPALFEPLAIGHLRLKNRIMSTSHAPAYAEDGMPKERYRRYHEEKAKGGLALTMFGGSSIVSVGSPPPFGQIDLGTDRVIPWLRAFAEAVHRHGCATMIQITHMGRRTGWSSHGWLPTIAPSAVREPAHRSFPKAMDRDDIDRVVGDFAAAAGRAQGGSGRSGAGRTRGGTGERVARPRRGALRGRGGARRAGAACRARDLAARPDRHRAMAGPGSGAPRSRHAARRLRGGVGRARRGAGCRGRRDRRGAGHRVRRGRRARGEPVGRARRTGPAGLERAAVRRSRRPPRPLRRGVPRRAGREGGTGDPGPPRPAAGWTDASTRPRRSACRGPVSSVSSGSSATPGSSNVPRR